MGYLQISSTPLNGVEVTFDLTMSKYGQTYFEMCLAERKEVSKVRKEHVCEYAMAFELHSIAEFDDFRNALWKEDTYSKSDIGVVIIQKELLLLFSTASLQWQQSHTN